jgi:hypothetical protein
MENIRSIKIKNVFFFYIFLPNFSCNLFKKIDICLT